MRSQRFLFGMLIAVALGAVAIPGGAFAGGAGTDSRPPEDGWFGCWVTVGQPWTTGATRQSTGFYQLPSSVDGTGNYISVAYSISIKVQFFWETDGGGSGIVNGPTNTCYNTTYCGEYATHIRTWMACANYYYGHDYGRATITSQQYSTSTPIVIPFEAGSDDNLDYSLPTGRVLTVGFIMWA